MQVRSELTRKLKNKENALNELGEERDTTEKQSKYLLGIIERFNQLTSQALDASYKDGVFDRRKDLRLVTELRNRNGRSKDDTENFGHEYCFEPTPTNHIETFIDPKTRLEICWSGQIKKRSDSERVDTRKLEDHADHVDLEGIICDKESLPLPCDKGMIDRIEKLHYTSRKWRHTILRLSPQS